MNPYLNRCLLQGRITSAPRIKSLNSHLQMTFFQLSVEETWTSKGKEHSRSNRIAVEVLGKDAKAIAEEASMGMWATIEGYIRTEEYQGRTKVKVRTLNIEVWSHETATAAGDRGRPQAANVPTPRNSKSGGS